MGSNTQPGKLHLTLAGRVDDLILFPAPNIEPFNLAEETCLLVIVAVSEVREERKEGFCEKRLIEWGVLFEITE